MGNTVLVRGKLAETAGFSRRNELLHCGLPFAQGVLKAGGDFVLETGGRAFRMDGVPAAWWPDGSVRWLRRTSIPEGLIFPNSTQCLGQIAPVG